MTTMKRKKVNSISSQFIDMIDNLNTTNIDCHSKHFIALKRSSLQYLYAIFLFTSDF